ncbi:MULTISPECIES: hypothetical protein [unclassified Streptomyces]|uniref:hypothetical protein n=1 Tax=unclassified Streptomyces TaxID=2593676 RepID=UPI0022565CF5|nr:MULTISPECIES: hypothetical protein [unclassified Streptomyces]MCX4885067.1 hypothetical protein [Streptomyces sp. NBC_00847]MCX5424956.1 hypothetical protein [Streptomyces sp. NBC_00078]
MSLAHRHLRARRQLDRGQAAQARRAGGGHEARRSVRGALLDPYERTLVGTGTRR